MDQSQNSESLANTIIGSEQWIERLYEDLHRLASSYLQDEPATVSLSPTVVIHELYLRLPTGASAMTRAHFFAVAATCMRRILVDQARRRRRKKRGGAARRQLFEDDALSITDSEEVLAMDEALQELAKLDERQAKIVELRFFAGMTVAEVADHLKLSKRTIEGEWTMAKAWLRRWLISGEAKD